ncbi:MAG: hypothetical protein ACO1OQ_03535 [Rufibacter sp.]
MNRLLLHLLLLFSFTSTSAQLNKGAFVFNDTSKVAFKANSAFQLGGKSKLTLLPKLNLIRIH